MHSVLSSIKKYFANNSHFAKWDGEKIRKKGNTLFFSHPEHANLLRSIIWSCVTPQEQKGTAHSLAWQKHHFT